MRDINRELANLYSRLGWVRGRSTDQWLVDAAGGRQVPAYIDQHACSGR